MRVGIIGHFGGNKNFVDGQSVKVKSLYRAFVHNIPSIKVDKIDTYYLRKNPIRFFASLINGILLDRKMVFLPAATGRKYMFRFFYYLSEFTNREFYHDCIAGSLDKEIREHPEWIKYLNSFKANWMESPSQVEILKRAGVNNASYLPNFKNLEAVEEDYIPNQFGSKRYFVTFSRVEPMKGIEDALQSIQLVNEKAGKILAVLDVYGPIQPGYESWLQDVLSRYHDICEYKGIIDPFESVNTLKDYYALLFPTRYYTEGMPGTIVDAMFAGLPVISRRWAWCDGMINNGYNGISYEFDKPERLTDIIEHIVNNPNEIMRMRKNCILESVKYSEQKVLQTIISDMKL